MISCFYGWVSLPCYGIDPPTCMISCLYSGWVSLPCYGIVTYMYDFMFLRDGSVSNELGPTSMISCVYGWVSLPCYRIMTYMYD